MILESYLFEVLKYDRATHFGKIQAASLDAAKARLRRLLKPGQTGRIEGEHYVIGDMG